MPQISDNSIYFILVMSYHLPAHTEESLIYELLEVIYSEFTRERMENELRKIILGLFLLLITCVTLGKQISFFGPCSLIYKAE